MLHLSHFVNTICVTVVRYSFLVFSPQCTAVYNNHHQWWFSFISLEIYWILRRVFEIVLDLTSVHFGQWSSGHSWEQIRHKCLSYICFQMPYYMYTNHSFQSQVGWFNRWRKCIWRIHKKALVLFPFKEWVCQIQKISFLFFFFNFHFGDVFTPVHDPSIFCIFVVNYHLICLPKWPYFGQTHFGKPP